MTDPWFVILRDFTVILAAAAVILVSLFTAMVAWRVYKLARELRTELDPIMKSTVKSVDTAHESAAFVSERRLPSPVAAFGLVAGIYQLANLAREFQRSVGEPAADGESPALPDARSPVPDAAQLASPAPVAAPRAAGTSDTGAT